MTRIQQKTALTHKVSSATWKTSDQPSKNRESSPTIILIFILPYHTTLSITCSSILKSTIITSPIYPFLSFIIWQIAILRIIAVRPLTFKRMINRLRVQKDNQWRTSQQLPIKPSRSPQKLQEEHYTNPYTRGQENQNSNRNAPKTVKPLISPKRVQNTDRTRNNLSQRLPQPRNIHTQRQPQNNCLNHPSKRAEFMVTQAEEQEFYCGRCAAQLATRGCEVVRLQAAATLKVSKKNELPYYPQYEHQPIYQQILEILRLCNGSIADHNANIDRFAGLEQQYQHQIQLTSSFYDRLIEIIQEMKTDHLFDLAQQKDKYTQIADIENDHLRENIIQINGIKNDIENHLEEVLEGIRESGNEAECRESLEHYRQKLTLFDHQIQEQLESLKDITRYPKEKINSMTWQFQNFLKVLWDTEEAQSQLPLQSTRNLNSALTVKNIHQILPKGITGPTHEPKRAFRNLQEEEDQHFQERKSPNFKRI